MKTFKIISLFFALVLMGVGCGVSENKQNKPNNANPNSGSTKTPNGPTNPEKPSEGS